MSVVRREGRREQAVRFDQRRDPSGFLDSQHATAYAEGVLELDVALERRHVFPRRKEEQVADLVQIDLLPWSLRKALERFE